MPEGGPISSILVAGGYLTTQNQYVKTMLNKVIKFPIMAEHSADQIIVYQAFNAAIGEAAARAGTLDVSAFSKTRMTWIKPSFLWMMYRSGWGRKDPGQQVILRLTMTREGFAHILRNACLSSYDPAIYPDHAAWQADLAAHPNRVQWDPDKDLRLQPLDRRAIQIGIAGAFVPYYLAAALTGVEDITADAQEIEALVASGQLEKAGARIPKMTEVPAEYLTRNTTA